MEFNSTTGFGGNESYGIDFINPKITNQDGCGDCWAFAGVAALESHYMIQGYSESVKPLSVNQIKNCVNK
jgi:C1A family cysteine protease